MLHPVNFSFPRAIANKTPGAASIISGGFDHVAFRLV
jgi:hypothetical protein